MSRLHYALSRIAVVFVTFSAPFLSHWFSPITVDFIPSPFLSPFYVPLKGDIHLQLQYFVSYYSISAASSSSRTLKKEWKSGVMCRTLSRLANSLKQCLQRH